MGRENRLGKIENWIIAVGAVVMLAVFAALRFDYYYDFQIIQILRAVKTLPLEIALSIADPKLPSFELERKRKDLEESYLKQLLNKNVVGEFSFEKSDELKETQKIKCIKN